MSGAKSFALAIILGAISSQAFAAVIIETETYGPATPNYNQTLTFTKFNPALGTLNSVKVEMGVSVSGGSLTVDNDSDTGGAHVDVELGAEGDLSSGDVVLLDVGFNPVVADVTASTLGSYDLDPNVGDGAGDYDSSAPDGALMLGGAVSNSDSGFIAALFFPGYSGLGTFDINALVNQILDFGGVGGVEGAFSPVTADGFVRVTYEYTPLSTVPEPGSFLVFGCCLLPVVLRRLRQG